MCHIHRNCTHVFVRRFKQCLYIEIFRHVFFLLLLLLSSRSLYEIAVWQMGLPSCGWKLLFFFLFLFHFFHLIISASLCVSIEFQIPDDYKSIELLQLIERFVVVANNKIFSAEMNVRTVRCVHT